MRFETRFKALSHLLKENKELWNKELINHFPGDLSHLTGFAYDFLIGKNPSELYEMRIGDTPSPLSSLFMQIDELCTFPRSPDGELEIQKELKMFLTEKKVHEISQVLPFLKKRIPQKTKKLLDLAGGQGHFSQIFCHQLKVPTALIDFDPLLLKKAKARYLELQKNDSPSLIFLEEDLLQEESPNLTKHFSSGEISVGLHTCGPLTDRHFNLLETPGHEAALNFSCCYHRLNHPHKLDSAKDLILPFTSLTKEALTLATRTPIESAEEIAQGFLVKRFRMGLHIYFLKETPIKEFFSLGNTPLRYYQGDFREYALYQFQRLNWDNPEAHAAAAEKIYKDSFTQTYIDEYLALNFVRNQFGRPLEVLIILDRALKLQARGYEVEVYEFFDRKKSPRSLGIWAHRRQHKPNQGL